ELAPRVQRIASVHIAEGDSAEAGVALARAERLADPSDPSFATLAMLELAYAWRFLPRDQALARTDELVARARAAGIADLDAGARYLAGLGSPEGELAFAERLARRGARARALELTEALTDLPVRDIDDPFFRAVLHALRAQWYERAGQPARASRELLWAENTDVMGYPTGSPQAAEVDWAF